MLPADPRLASLRDALVGQVLRGSAGVSYYLRELIGEGGQGWVFKANWEEPGGLVVIVKVLRPDAVHNESLPRFQREAEVLRMLSQQPRPNPYIVRFYDHAVAHFRSPSGGENLALPFTVLEYVHGPTLEQVLAGATHGLPVERARRLLSQVVHALELVHSQKVVHRDLKPSNILLATEAGAEIAKVTDFGIVKRVDMNLQRTTTLAGASLGYAPPEQYEQGNQRVTPKTDVFSLATIVFEMLSGMMAFPFSERENPLLIVTRILNGPRPALMRVRDRLAPELQGRVDIIEPLDAQLRRGTAADPADRPESVTELWGSIEPLLREATLASDAPPSALPFASTDLARTRPSNIGSPGSRTELSGPPVLLRPEVRVRVNPLAASPNLEAVRAAGHGANLRAVAPTASDAAANPVSWTWRILTRPLKEKLVSAASFASSGELAIAAGSTGLARWERGTWAGLALPAGGFDVRSLRGVRLALSGDLVLFGNHSLFGRISARGTWEVITIPDRELIFRAAHLDATGMITLVGERPLRRSAAAGGESIGAIAQLSEGKVDFIVDVPAVTRLHSITRITSGSLLACGDWGALVRVDGAVADHVGSICRGHLAAIEALDDGGAVTVGAGGHALHVSARLDAQLEAVQTTRDLLALARGTDGVAWAGAAQARLLRRNTDSWVRMSGDVGITPSVVAIWASDQVVRAICEDGAVIEGRLA
jgi:serine/threonine protein kinase